MNDRLDSDDWGGALLAAEAALRCEPANVVALDCARRCRTELRALYTSRLGSLHRVPRLATAIDDVVSLALDVRTGYLLSRIDGLASIEQIVSRGVLPPVDTLRVLSELYLQRVIELDEEEG